MKIIIVSIIIVEIIIVDVEVREEYLYYWVCDTWGGRTIDGASTDGSSHSIDSILDHDHGKFLRAMEWSMVFVKAPLYLMVFQWFLYN